MLKFISGDILDSKAEAIAQGIACSKTENMTTGIAKQIDKKFPEAFKQFKAWREYSVFVPGDIWISKTFPIQIYLATQKNLQRAELEFVELSLQNLRQFVLTEKIKSLALPKIGCGHGKLEWNRIKPLIQKCLSGSDCEIFVYETYIKPK